MSNLENKSVTQLYHVLNQHMSDGHKSIAKACEIIVELRKRGEIVECTRTGVYRYYREIAAGQLTAAAVVAFCGMPDMLKRLAGQPAAEQDELASGKRVPVVVGVDNGEPVVRELDVIRMSRQQRDCVFTPDAKPVPVAEQAKTVKVREHERAKVGERKKLVPVKAETGSDSVRVGEHLVPAVRLAEALRALGYAVTR
ncbi:hypothetical protein [Rhizobium phage RHph_X2_26]|nr:hypothetical protein [Rhizobium phage RHph_X2_26]